MDKKSIIKELYWNIEEISDSFIPTGPEYEEVVRIKEEKQQKLLALLPEGSQEVFEEFVMAMGDVEILQDEEIYRQGFCFGMQLTAEAYVMNRNKLVTYGDE